MTGLPQGWVRATLEEISETRLGKMLSAKAKVGTSPRPYLRNKNVQWGHIDVSDMAEMDFDEDEIERFTVVPGDVLVCEGGEVGRTAVWRGQLPWVGYQKALHRIRPAPGVSSEYLAYLMRWFASVNAFDPYVTGSTIKHLPQEDLRLLPVPVPPAREQQRIVAAIEEQFSRLDVAEASLQRALRRIAVLRQWSLDRCAAADNVLLAPLAHGLREPLVNGRSVPTRDGGFPVLRLTALRDGRVDVRESKMGDWTEADAEPFLVEEGDFLVARGNGSRHLVGRGGLVEEEPPRVAFPDTVIRIRVDEAMIRRRYLRLVWDSRSVREQIEGQARTTAGIYKVNQDILRSTKLPFPPVEEQDRLVLAAEHQLSVLDVLAARCDAALQRTEPLRRSILKKAFDGGLVPQDRADEPASRLLEQIAARRATDPDIRRRRRKVPA